MKDLFKFLLSIFILSLISLEGIGQSFIDRFPKLSEENLPSFFDEWQRYSEDVSKTNFIRDSIIAKVIEQEISLIKFDTVEYAPGKFPKFYVVPQEINVDRYHVEADISEALENNGVPNYLPKGEEEVYEVYKVAPPLPEDALYYTEAFDRPLWEFLGGTNINGEREAINDRNVRAVKEYIPVMYGHWGGYWFFYSMPLIQSIVYFDNLIAISRRTGWNTGDLIWYVREENGFERVEKPLGNWIE